MPPAQEPAAEPESSSAEGAAESIGAEVRARLERLNGRPAAEHVAVFDEVHRHLSGALERLAPQDADPPSSPPPPGRN